MMQPATNTRHYRLDPAQAYLHIDKAELNHDVLADLTRKISKNPVIYHTTGIAKEGGGIFMDHCSLSSPSRNSDPKLRGGQGTAFLSFAAHQPGQQDAV